MIRFFLVPKIGSCEHSKNDLPTHGSVILKKRMEIEHALLSSDTLFERRRRRQKQNLKIGLSKGLRPIFGTKNRVLEIGLCERAFTLAATLFESI